MVKKSNSDSGSDQRENPRTVRVRKLMLEAAVELLLVGGAGEVTAARIAEETGVARTTIYRQWPDQASLLLATIDSLVTPHYASPGSGNLQADLTTALTDLRTRVMIKQVRPVFAALIDYAARDDAFADAQRRFIEGIMQPTLDVLTEAQDRGDLLPTLDCSVALATLTGPLFHQLLVLGDSVDDDFIDEVLSQFMKSHNQR